MTVCCSERDIQQTTVPGSQYLPTRPRYPVPSISPHRMTTGFHLWISPCTAVSQQPAAQLCLLIHRTAHSDDPGSREALAIPGRVCYCGGAGLRLARPARRTRTGSRCGSCSSLGGNRVVPAVSQFEVTVQLHTHCRQVVVDNGFLGFLPNTEELYAPVLFYLCSRL